MSSIVEMKTKMFLREAQFYIGVREVGNNGGPFVEMFQSALSKPGGQSWCMSFVQFCVRKVDSLWQAVDFKIAPTGLAPSEHCLSVWRRTPPAHRAETPLPGMIVIWQHGVSEFGHTGIIENVKADKIQTIEGNTNAFGEREGDGVFRKTRQICNLDQGLKVVGYLRPWV